MVKDQAIPPNAPPVSESQGIFPPHEDASHHRNVVGECDLFVVLVWQTFKLDKNAIFLATTRDCQARIFIVQFVSRLFVSTTGSAVAAEQAR